MGVSVRLACFQLCLLTAMVAGLVYGLAAGRTSATYRASKEIMDASSRDKFINTPLTAFTLLTTAAFLALTNLPAMCYPPLALDGYFEAGRLSKDPYLSSKAAGYARLNVRKGPHSARKPHP
jgi:hypothetical protein